MAIGDLAKQQGYLLVPGSGEDGKVKYGNREINRTRDYIASLKASMPNLPTSKDGFRRAAGISSGTSNPSGGTDGDIYFKIL